jgi:hypothetical protein
MSDGDGRLATRRKRISSQLGDNGNDEIDKSSDWRDDLNDELLNTSANHMDGPNDSEALPPQRRRDVMSEAIR